MAKDKLGHGSEKRGVSAVQARNDRMFAMFDRAKAQGHTTFNAEADAKAASELARGNPKSSAVPVHDSFTGVDGMGMTPEEAGQHVAAGRMPLGPPLGVYRDEGTFARFKAAKEGFGKGGTVSQVTLGGKVKQILTAAEYAKRGNKFD